MSSPHLNNLIIIGCMFTYSSVIFLGLDSQLSSVTAFPYICTARAWLLMAGFSLAFGSMFSKTWRVHSIFTDVKLNKKVSTLNGQGMSYLRIAMLDIYTYVSCTTSKAAYTLSTSRQRPVKYIESNARICKFLVDSPKTTFQSFKMTIASE